jgi:hypothetical protein
VQQLSQMDAQELRQVLGELNLPSWVRSVAWRQQSDLPRLLQQV